MSNYRPNRIAKKIVKTVRSVIDKQLLFPYKLFLLWLNNVHYKQFPAMHGFPTIVNSGTIHLGKGVSITAKMRNNIVGGSSTTALATGKNGKITVGNNVGISNATIFSLEQIVIEDDVLIGGGAQIYDSDFHSIEYTKRMERPDTNIRTAPVYIGQGAFIGTSAIIMKGIKIGERSVVAAGSVVTKSIPPDEIWGGNPAKFIKKIESSQ